jgi:formate dehydrogenase maturation protein FdhE
MSRRELLEKLYKDMKYCPVCGENLKPTGPVDGLLKSCESHHGVMYVIGKRQGSRVGILLEVPEE